MGTTCIPSSHGQCVVFQWPPGFVCLLNPCFGGSFSTHSPWPKVLTFCEHGLEGEGKGSHKQLLEKEVWRRRGYSCDLSFSYFLLKTMGYTTRSTGLISCSLCTTQLREPLWPSFTGSCKCSIRVVSSHRRTDSLRCLSFTTYGR